MNQMDLRYPLLEVKLNKIASNAEEIIHRCKSAGVDITGVIKGCNAYPEVAVEFIEAGCSSIGSSRIDQLKPIAELGASVETMLLRSPMHSEIDDVVAYATISLNSDRSILLAINDACMKRNTVHKIILMADLGDLREGIWDQKSFLELAEWVENELSWVELHGIGTNLGCYGAIKPTETNMNTLCQLADAVEQKIMRPLSIVSGGATTALPLVLDGTMPTRINHLRVGEGILLGRDLEEFFGLNVDYLNHDTFILKAEVIEVQDKPSLPVGESFVDAFGNKPVFHDKGIQKRAILAVGKQDFGDHSKLIPIEQGIQIIGSSSDHLIVEISRAEESYMAGDHLSFMLFYQSMLYLSLSDDVQKVFIS